MVFTKPSGESTAKTNLERQGFRVYFPRVLHRKLSRGTWRDSISALFPRYLFVQLNTMFQSLAPVRSTPGVSGVVRFGTEYAPVPEHIVKDLISRENGTGLHRLTLSAVFRVGTAVKVIEGALTGIEGIFQREEANERVVVLLNLLGRDTRIEVPSHCIAPIG